MEVKFRNIETMDADVEASLKAPYTIRLFANRQLYEELPASHEDTRRRTRMCKHARGPQFSSHRSIVGDDPRDARLCSQPGVEHEVPIYCHIEGRVPLARCIEPEAPCRLTKVEIQPRPLLRCNST
jgi:hypothetical protein